MFDSNVLETDFFVNDNTSPDSQVIIKTISNIIPKDPKSHTTVSLSRKNKTEDFRSMGSRYKTLTGELKYKKRLSLVRAIYDFNLPKLSSLKFVAGDIIEVLNRMENGWWDGVLGDQRGWFPSNYVQHLDENEINEFEEDENNDHDTYNIQIGLEQNMIEENSIEYLHQESQDIKANDHSLRDSIWISDVLNEKPYYPNTEKESSEASFPYFLASNDQFNSNSKKVHKKKSLSLTTDKKLNDLSFLLDMSSVLKSPYFENDITEKMHRIENKEESKGVHLYTFPQRSPSMKGLSPLEAFIISSYEDKLNIVSSSEASLHNEDSSRISDSDDGSSILMPIYYCPLQSSIDSKDDKSTYLNSKALKLIPEELIPSYKKILQNMRQSINDLHKFVELKMKVLFQKLCDSIRITIIYLVHASGMLRIVSILGNSLPTIISISESDFKTIKWYYWRILTALSKLILSTKLASSEWLPENIKSSVLNDAEDIIIIVEEYIKFIVSKNSIYRTPCKFRLGFIKDRQVGGGWRGNGLIVYTKPTVHNNILLELEIQSSDNLTLKPLSQELLSKLNTSLNEIKCLLNYFQKKLLKPSFSDDEKKASIIISDFFIIHETKTILKSIRIFMEMIESVDVTPLEETCGDTYSPTLFDFLNAKQALYDSINTFVLIVQSFPKFINIYNNNPIMSIVNSSRNINCSLQSLMMTIEFLVGEKEIRTKKCSEDPMYSHHRTSSKKLSMSSNISMESDDSKSVLKASPTTPRTKTKLKKIFGDESPFGKCSPQKVFSMLETQNEPIPWFLKYNHEGKIIYDEQGCLKAGTLVGLIEHLTRHDLLDSLFNNTLLLTYRTFTSAENFFNLLVERFMIAPPENLKPHELEIWIEKKQKPVRLRVFNILKIWLESYFMEPMDENSERLLNQIKEFTINILSESISGENLVRIIDKRMKNEDRNYFRKLMLNIGFVAPPILPKNLRRFKLLDLDPLEVARQLTIMESRIYNKIKPIEFLNKAWSKHLCNGIAENIRSMILKSNQITGWVTQTILSQTEVKKRVRILKHFINIADRCRSLNNFSTVTSIISGINSAPIHRLKRTWELVTKKTINTFDSLNKMMDSTKNFSEYRELLRLINPPCVPFLGVYLTDLTFIEDGNPDMIKNSKDFINFSKRIKTAEIIREIQQYQSISYSFQVVPEIQSYLLECLEGMDKLNDMYDLSLGIEPRERDDEKLARLLQESVLL
ncbi:hypothetical protein PNEG_01634 [Pneumocystis murina B123]|uniref:Cell division control protein 25 n=1 Tax=Pneumocystis murina (strain B123) TaxID=1069680 RepID=M7NSX7_PNEMU|nr:hypothetical protein PNEG_01634 [Pneumocystis murina B123]EMR10382.1 hypothetical protein PNEG_01634 [Pneumocystis murina B123]